MEKLYKNKDWLYFYYWMNMLNTYEIAKIGNTTAATIRRWMINFGVPFRVKGYSLHLAKANHCDLSITAKEWLDGELLGDGCLSSYKYSSRFSYASKYYEYIYYVAETLKSFGIAQAGKINRCFDQRMNCYYYQYVSIMYDELLPIYELWYPNAEKIVPRDLKLTPLVCRQWYIGDGSLLHRKNRNDSISLSTCGFSKDDVEWLVIELNNLGFNSTRMPSANKIHIHVNSTKTFLDFIGVCPVECYQYKWNYNKEI